MADLGFARDGQRENKSVRLVPVRRQLGQIVASLWRAGEKSLPHCCHVRPRSIPWPSLSGSSCFGVEVENGGGDGVGWWWGGGGRVGWGSGSERDC